jgi:hypothetical protein
MAIYYQDGVLTRADRFAVAVLAALVSRPDRSPELYAENNVKLATRMGKMMAEASPLFFEETDDLDPDTYYLAQAEAEGFS